MKEILFLAILTILQWQCESGILYPRVSAARELHSLDGLWKFSLSKTTVTSFDNGNWSWYGLEDNDEDLELMAVPSSYNDLSTNVRVRDYVGIVRYQRNFIVPRSWAQKRIWLRFSSVSNDAEVYINEKLAASHTIGRLPFEEEITSFLNIGNDNNITVLVNNVLTADTIPQGSLQTLPNGRVKQNVPFDFFNYAGIDRPVVLYTTDQTYIDDITITTEVRDTSAVVNYDVAIVGDYSNSTIEILDKDGRQISIGYNPALKGVLTIPNVNLWWPYLMSDDPGYLYTLKIDVFDSGNKLIDRYEQPFGVREITWDESTVKINGKPLYLRGFGRHEDSDMRGKGLDLPVVLRDHNLMKWIGANCYRTSHYPYAEETMDLADSLGIMIIDEAPAASLTVFGNVLLENHKRSITELIKRDKNRPSVISWSLAHEPDSSNAASEDYFRQVTAHARSLDSSRPLTIANKVTADVDYSGQFFDILGIDKYTGWYESTGDIDTIVSAYVSAAEAWHTKYNKPILTTEYGADAMEGFNVLPTFIWSEAYQLQLIADHIEAFDILREKGWFIGELISTFADFKTVQVIYRVGSDKKGLFTRERQPKAGAHVIRERYWGLAEALDNVVPPSDLKDNLKKITKSRTEF